jgi:exosortase A-associated hydrolase 1
MTQAALEEPITILCAGDVLQGILARPSSGSERDVAIVIIVGGPQYRIGSHRQFTQFARAVARAGYPVLRFDVRGMGDSTGALRSFESMDDDIAAAVSALQLQLPAVRQVVLWGLCDGASAALLYLHARADPRIRGLCLLNPWVRSEAGMATTRVRYYYARRLLQNDFWRKLLGGRVGVRALREFWATWRLARAAAATPRRSFQERMIQAWSAFDGQTLLVLSGDDYTAREFIVHAEQHPEWRERMARADVRRVDFPNANHTFAEAQDRVGVESTTVSWLNSWGLQAEKSGSFAARGES